MSIHRKEILFDIVVYFLVLLAGIITLYPFVYVFSMSISDPTYVLRNEIVFLPKGFSLGAYEIIFRSSLIFIGLYNSLWYTVVGTVLNVIFTVMAAYPLARKRFFAKNFFTVIFVFTMFFGGGLIPNFILVNEIGLYNTRWALVIPGLISTWLLIICRSFIQTIPEELFESAKIDGCSEFKFIYKILLPLIRPILAVLAIYYGVDHWNAWFNALLYLSNSNLYPVQIYLRQIVLQASSQLTATADAGGSGVPISLLQVKYAVIFVVSLPIITVYPFFQKHFVKGMLIGSLKG